MAVCRTCGKEWPANHAVCPADGTRLGMPSLATVGSLAPSLAVSTGFDEELAPGSFAGEYQIERKIGEGGMGSVYGARHPLIGKRAAIKVIRRALSANPEAVDRFIREAQAVNTIGHPNIVDVFSFGQLPDGRSFLVMEWLQGESLGSRLERPLTYEEALDIIDTIAKALVAAHDAGVVHRDLKPDNVFLVEVKDEKPVVMLLDFGLAKLSGDADGRADRTRTGVVMGTPLYISPEQAKGTQVEAATDIYALGAMAYEMFTGRVPFLADSAVEIMSLHITDDPVPPTRIRPNLPPQVDVLVLAMMAKHPAERTSLPQVRTQVAGLRGLAASTSLVGGGSARGAWPMATPSPANAQAPGTGHPPATARSTPSATAAPSSTRRIGLIAGIAIALVGAGVVLALVIGGKDEAPPATEVAMPAPVATTPDPVKTEPVKTEPVKSEPVKTEPVKSEPVKTEPVKTEPVKTEPVKTEPVKSGPVKSGSVTPRPTTPSKPGTVLIKIAGATRGRIFVDGKLVGRGLAQLQVALPPGDHTIRAQSPRHTPAETKIHVDAGGTATVTLMLQMAGGDVNGVYDPFGD